MRKIMKGSAALFAVLLLVASARTMAYNKVEKPLYAGQHILIGKLIVEQYKVTVGNRIKKMLRVTYDTTSSGWTMQATHLYVSKNAPTKSAPGRFPFKHEGLDNVTVDVYEIPLSQLLCSDKKLYIAAHADTCDIQSVPDYISFAEGIPATLTPTVYAFNLPFSYLSITPLGFPTYPVWCVDLDRSVRLGVEIPSAYYPGYNPDGSTNQTALDRVGPAATGFAADPMKMLAYLLNRDYVRDCGNGGPYTWADIQAAIWHITNGYPETSFPANTDAILTDVIQNSGAYVPQPGDLAPVIVDPQTLRADGTVLHEQPVIYGVPLGERIVSGDCETAWARGDFRFKTGWGSYFIYLTL